MKEYVSLCHAFQHELTAITWSKDKTVTRHNSYYLFEFQSALGNNASPWTKEISCKKYSKHHSARLPEISPKMDSNIQKSAARLSFLQDEQMLF
jgi:hypothetical protein